jgi:protein subunit release factor B
VDRRLWGHSSLFRPVANTNLQNKTSSAVQLKHLPTGLVIKSQETRSRSQNRKIARTILAEKLEEMEKGDKSRTAIKADIKKKKKASANKKAKRKYKALAEERSDDADDDGGDLEVTDDPQIEEVRK